MAQAPPPAAVPTEERRPSRPARQAGYVVALVMNALFMWVVNNLLAWEWFSWLTEDFADVLPAINRSIIATFVVYGLLLFYDEEWFKVLGDAVTAVFSLLAGIVMWQVFPFDFTAYAFDWALVARILIGLGIFGVSIGILVNVVKFLGMAAKGFR